MYNTLRLVHTLNTCTMILSFSKCAAAPDPSPPTFVQNTSDVCFESNSSVPVRYYQVLITDNTGDTSNTTYFGVRSCTSLSELQYVCAPFTITVTAHTEFSSSRPGVYVVNGKLN